jgi:DNA-binding transcriptional MocR family regulator
MQGTASIPRELLFNPEVSTNAKMIYLCLNAHVDARMQCWPSHATLAEESGLSLATVKRALLELRNHRLVSWVKTQDHGAPGNRPNLYTLGAGSDSSHRAIPVAQPELLTSSIERNYPPKPPQRGASPFSSRRTRRPRSQVGGAPAPASAFGPPGYGTW